MSNLSRRKFILTASATTTVAVVANACSSPTTTAPSPEASPAAASPAAPSPVAAADAPEVTTAKLGFIALTDSAPLIIAKEKGLFAKYGMPDVEVMKQTSWAVTRDNLELGSAGGGIDGAHILSPMPYFLSVGKNKSNKPVPMYILARLNTNGQGIALSNDYKDLNVTTDAAALKPAIEKAMASGKKFKGAVTFPGGNHDLWTRYWLAAAGINPITDVDLVVIPPPQMVANMETKTMDMFCVGEPWPGRLVSRKLGYNALTTGEIWKDHPEKAFTVRADWADKHPNATKALTMAVQEAQIWCDKAENKEELCQILSADKYVKAPAKDILGRMQGNFDFGNGRTLENSPLLMKFWADQASFPFKSHDLWFLTEDIRWGYLPGDTDTKKLVDSVNRDDIWREAAKAIGQDADAPKESSRGVETFLDGYKFDPAKPEEYLKGLKIKKA
jgi:nitrate/nitrite transport system substrate-binding protein